VYSVPTGRALRAVLSLQPSVRPSQPLGRERPALTQREEAPRAAPRSKNKGGTPSQAEATALKETKSSLEERETKRR
jgi:hypothetical protein